MLQSYRAWQGQNSHRDKHLPHELPWIECWQNGCQKRKPQKLWLKENNESPPCSWKIWRILAAGKLDMAWPCQVQELGRDSSLEPLNHCNQSWIICFARNNKREKPEKLSLKRGSKEGEERLAGKTRHAAAVQVRLRTGRALAASAIPSPVWLKGEVVCQTDRSSCLFILIHVCVCVCMKKAYSSWFILPGMQLFFFIALLIIYRESSLKSWSHSGDLENWSSTCWATPIVQCVTSADWSSVWSPVLQTCRGWHQS